MSRTTTTIDDAASVSLPREAVDALGVKAGEELDVEIVGRAVVGSLCRRGLTLPRVYRYLRVYPEATPQRL